MRRLGLLILVMGILAGCDRFDRSFGEGGVVRIGDVPDAVLPNGDGVVVVGERGVQAFDSSGRARGEARRWPDGLGGELEAALDDEGRILAASTLDRSWQAAVVRVRNDGHLDTEFGVEGVTTPGLELVPRAVEVGPSGRILVAGDDDGAVVVVALTDRGELDEGFGTGGVARSTPLSNMAVTDLLVRPDGRFVVTGTHVRSECATRSPCDQPDAADFAAVGFEPDGDPDRSFGRTGTVTVDFGGFDRGLAAELQPDGRIIIAGATNDVRDGRGVGPRRLAVTRLAVGGTVDSFGLYGRSIIEQGVALDPADLVLLPGGDFVAVLRDAAGDLVTVGFRADGVRDEAWGDRGVNRTDLGGNEGHVGGALVRGDDGSLKIITAGEVHETGSRHGVLTRYDV